MQCPIWLFHLVLCFGAFPLLLRYVLNDSEMVPVLPVIYGVMFAFTFHMR